MQLTPRAEKIIRILIRFPQGHPVTVSIISEELKISDRSVHRELTTVEKWLTANGFRFVRKRSIGLSIDEPESRKQELLDLVDLASGNQIPFDDRKQRQYSLCRELLFTDEPYKSFYFTDKYKISKDTLQSDLNQLTPWFEKYHLKLIRRPGLGIFLTGSEIARRQAITSLLCNQVNQKQNYDMLHKPDTASVTLFPVEFGDEIIQPINEILVKCEKQLNLHLSENGYLHLLIYLSLVAQRMQQKKYITEKVHSLEELSIFPEYAVAEYLMLQLRPLFQLPVSEDETLYLTTFLSGIRIWPSDTRDLTRSRDFNIHQLTLDFIKTVGEQLSIDFASDSQLLKDLSAHLQPTIGRLQAGIPIDNPLLQDFQTNYSDIYAACKKATSIFCEALSISEVPASEIGFITIYFVMAKERRETLHQQLSIILVCPAGIGSSRLLASNLKKAYPNLNICGTFSTFNLDCEKLVKEHIDLIVSTVKLNTSYRYLQVSPLLTRQDKMLLDSKIRVLLQQKRSQDSTLSATVNTPLTREDTEYISALSGEIYQVLDNIRIGQAPVLRNRMEIIAHSASLFADTLEMEQHLHKILLERDRLADTYIKPFYALLLHGVSPLITHPRFGYIHLEPPVYENARIITGALVSLIPENDPNRIAAQIASEIIGALLEDPELLKALRKMDNDQFTCLLENPLLCFYQRQAAEHLHLKAEKRMTANTCQTT